MMMMMISSQKNWQENTISMGSMLDVFHDGMVKIKWFIHIRTVKYWFGYGIVVLDYSSRSF